MFRKVLVANRGEIALRVIRTCRELGVRTVAVYSEADRDALHVIAADEAYLLGAPEPRESYLSIEKILRVARSSGAEAIHPGYGFLSENPAFARACCDAGVTFVGPSPETLAMAGSKTAARSSMARAGLPIIEGSGEQLKDLPATEIEAERLGYPLFLKAVAGGGGKGLRMVASPQDLPTAFSVAQGEAQTAFGDGRLYLEKVLQFPRHVEVQVLADSNGNVMHLGERECSLQRRHQKLMEESPSPFISPDLRERLTQAALQAASALGYTNAGTIEFLVTPDEHFYFLEVNPRLQVEHGVTELVTGVDLVKAQLLVAAGEPLAFCRQDIQPRGWAVECRVYAEDPFHGFLPSPGRVEVVREPGGMGVRVDSGLYEGCVVSLHYDPLLAKLMAWGRNRQESVARMLRVLSEYEIVGVATTIPLFRYLLSESELARGSVDTGFLDRIWDNGQELAGKLAARGALLAALAYHERLMQPGPAVTSKATGHIQSRWRDAARREGMRPMPGP